MYVCIWHIDYKGWQGWHMCTLSYCHQLMGRNNPCHRCHIILSKVSNMDLPPSSFVGYWWREICILFPQLMCFQWYTQMLVYIMDLMSHSSLCIISVLTLSRLGWKHWTLKVQYGLRVMPWSIWYIEVETKWTPCRRRHFQMHFLMKMYEFHLRFHWCLFLRFELRIYQHWLR